MTVFLVYYRDTGGIISVNTCDDTLYPDMPVPSWPIGHLPIPSRPVDVQTWLPTHYVDLSGSTVAASQPMTPLLDKGTVAADGVDTVTVSGLPRPCTVTIRGIISAGPFTIPDGEIALTADVPGEFIVSVTAPPTWLPWEVSINAY